MLNTEAPSLFFPLGTIALHLAAAPVAKQPQPKREIPRRPARAFQSSQWTCRKWSRTFNCAPTTASKHPMHCHRNKMSKGHSARRPSQKCTPSPQLLIELPLTAWLRIHSAVFHSPEISSGRIGLPSNTFHRRHILGHKNEVVLRIRVAKEASSAIHHVEIKRRCSTRRTGRKLFFANVATFAVNAFV